MINIIMFTYFSKVWFDGCFSDDVEGCCWKSLLGAVFVLLWGNGDDGMFCNSVNCWGSDRLFKRLNKNNILIYTAYDLFQV